MVSPRYSIRFVQQGKVSHYYSIGGDRGSPKPLSKHDVDDRVERGKALSIHPDTVRLISFTNQELITILGIMKKVVPSKDEEQTVVNIVNKVIKTLGT